MARYIGSVCRLCRRENVKMFLKGDRCFSDKCAIERRPYPPGQHGQGRQRASEYARQLREKQKVKRMYGLLEKQFRKYFHEAERLPGVTGANLLMLLERRLDNTIHRLGFASTRSEARQLVRHGHFRVDGRKVDIPSYRVRAGQVIEVKDKSQKIQRINDSMGAVERQGVPSWLELDADAYKGTVQAIPARDDVTATIEEQLIIELYSK
jgi:small subunit ribosomal protein S4